MNKEKIIFAKIISAIILAVRYKLGNLKIENITEPCKTTSNRCKRLNKTMFK